MSTVHDVPLTLSDGTLRRNFSRSSPTDSRITALLDISFNKAESSAPNALVWNKEGAAVGPPASMPLLESFASALNRMDRDAPSELAIAVRCLLQFLKA